MNQSSHTHTDIPDKSQDKYGRPLTGSDWVGLPLRVGHYPGDGTTGDLVADVDAILLWSGGVSHVNIQGHGPNTDTCQSHGFTRTSGMLDLLPQGTRLERIEWHGEATTCTAVNMPESCLLELSPELPNVLNAERGPEFCLVDAHVVDLTRRLQREAEGPDTLGAVYVQSLSLALASYVSARYGKATRNERALGPLVEGQRRRVVDFVEEHLSLNFGLVDLAALVGYSPDHFARLFKQTFTQSPHQYVLSRRLERAQAMLRDDSLSIAGIAIACGFSSQAHFSDAFKRHLGVTPSSYRKG